MYSWTKIEQAMNRANPVQLVKHFNDVPDSTKSKNMRWPAIAQRKYDGVYCMIVKIGDRFRFFSRTGNEFYERLHYVFACKGLLQLRDGCYITECVNSELSLEELSGAISTNRVERWDNDLYAAMLRSTDFIFHDYITCDEFIAGASSVPYEKRLQELSRYQGISIAYSVTCWSYEDWSAFVNEAINSNWEGAVLKQLHAGWKAGHKGWHAMKEVRGIHVDLMCEGVVMGTGKFEGLIAGLKFKWKGKQFVAGLGKGWDEEFQKVQTMAFLQDEFNVVNQIWHVYALQESSKGVLRLPKVGEMRIDKETPDGTD